MADPPDNDHLAFSIMINIEKIARHWTISQFDNPPALLPGFVVFVFFVWELN